MADKLTKGRPNFETKANVVLALELAAALLVELDPQIEIPTIYRMRPVTILRNAVQEAKKQIYLDKEEQQQIDLEEQIKQEQAKSEAQPTHADAQTDARPHAQQKPPTKPKK